jgi:hypothetical protein
LSAADNDYDSDGFGEMFVDDPEPTLSSSFQRTQHRVTIKDTPIRPQQVHTTSSKRLIQSPESSDLSDPDSDPIDSFPGSRSQLHTVKKEMMVATLVPDTPIK